MKEIDVLKNIVRPLAGVDLNDCQIQYWHPIAQQSNRLYQINFDNKTWIAKIFLKPDEFTDSPQREFDAMHLLSSLDIAPQPIHYEKHTASQNPIVIYEFMDGNVWDRYTPTTDELKQLANLWLTMNNVSTENLWLSQGFKLTSNQILSRFKSDFDNYLHWTETYFPEATHTAKLLQQIAKKRIPIIEQLFEFEPVYWFGRADPRFANVIRRPDHRLGMIDWEDSGLRDVARDIADIVTHPNQEDLLTWQEWQSFLEPYFAERRKVDPEIEVRVNLYHAVFPLFWLSKLVRYGMHLWETDQLDNWNVNTMCPNQRLRRYLARALAWSHMDIQKQLTEVEEFAFFDI